MDQARTPGPGELLLMLRDQGHLDLAALVPADSGESASTFLATGRDGTASVLKFGPGAAGESVGRLRELVARLRRRGYPAARLLASGQVAGMTFCLQERLPGTVLERVPVPGWLVPEVLRLNDAQAGLGDGTSRLSDLIAATLTTGGDGYCVHATLQARPDTRDMLAVVRQTAGRCLAEIPEGGDFVHYVLHARQPAHRRPGHLRRDRHQPARPHRRPGVRPGDHAVLPVRPRRHPRAAARPRAGAQ